MIDLDELERLAKAATPGPWSIDESQYADWGRVLGGDGRPVADTCRPCRMDDAAAARREKRQPLAVGANAAFIAAVHPATILELITEARATRTASSHVVACWEDVSAGCVGDAINELKKVLEVNHG